MMLQFARTTDGYQAWFALEDSSGALRTSAASIDFVATIVEPSDAGATNVPTVVESTTKSGLYKFSIPSAYLISNGPGEYGVVVEINVPAPKRVVAVLHGALVVSLEDFDSLSAGQVAIPSAVWTEVIDGSVMAGTIMSRMNSWVRGAVTLVGSLATYFLEDDVTVSHRNTKSPTTRTPT